MISYGKKFSIKSIEGLLYIAPWLIGFAVFQAYPFLASFVYSFTDFNLVSSPVFIQLKNYIEIFTNDDAFIQSMKVTFQYVLLAVPLKLIFALLIAMVLNVNLRFVNAFRTLYYIPSILGGSVAVATLWRILFMKEGTINQLLAIVQIPPINWFGSSVMALFTLSLLTVWQFGSSMVIFLAGLKQIPNELYEAARVDGASKVRTFFKITVPVLTPIILFNLVMQMINAFQEFTSAFIVTGGGPMKGTYLYGMKLYEEGFSYFKMGYASALSWILFVVILIVTVIIFKTSKQWTYYEDGGEF